MTTGRSCDEVLEHPVRDGAPAVASMALDKGCSDQKVPVPCQAVKSGGERGMAEGRCLPLGFGTGPGVSLQTRVAICRGSVDQLSAADNINIYKCYLTKE